MGDPQQLLVATALLLAGCAEEDVTAQTESPEPTGTAASQQLSANAAGEDRGSAEQKVTLGRIRSRAETGKDFWEPASPEKPQ